jgi:hypothetical protein
MVANLELVRKHLFRLHTHELGGAVDELLSGIEIDGEPGRKVEDLRMHVETAMTFMRTTSDDLGEELRYDLLDEHEWRLVALNNRPWIAGDGSEDNPLRVIIGVSDVELIVFPDAATRRMALDDDGIMSRLPAHRSDQPVMLTLEECRHF